MKQKQKKTEKLELDPREAELIRAIRNEFRFGRIVIITRNGRPVRIEETVRYRGFE